MRIAPAVVLSDEIRVRLEKLARGRSTPVRIAQRSRIILLAGEGLQNKEITEQMGVAPRMAALWRKRFLALGVDGLLKDASRPGRTPSISPDTVTRIIEKTTQSKPANATQWSRSTMAKEAGVSESSVGRIWRAHGLCQEKHRPQEWLKFLRMIDQTVPAEKQIYLICDNYWKVFIFSGCPSPRR